MAKYQPVEVRAIQWNRVLKVIAAASVRGMSIRDLAVSLGFESVTPELEKALTMLHSSGRIRVSIGRSPSNFQPCQFVQAVTDDPRIRGEPEELE